MVDQHDVQKNFECKICGKKFLLEWRLKKHEVMHTENPKMCQYFQNGQFCPFDQVGCQFSHDAEVVSEEAADDDYELFENQCHLCREKFLTEDDLWEHVETIHDEYYKGIKEFAAANPLCW